MSSKDTVNIIQGILTLLPLAEKIVFSIGGRLVALNTKKITSSDDVIKMLEESKSAGWPEFTFSNPEDKEPGA